MEHYLNICNVKGNEVKPVDVVTFGSPCFIAGTQVITSQGYKPIEEIQVGDMVLTHENRMRSVLKVGGNKSQPIYRLRTQGTLETYVTGNHPYYTRRKVLKINPETREFRAEFEEPKWVNVEDLSSDHYIMLHNDHWDSTLSPSDCPSKEDCFELGKVLSTNLEAKFIADPSLMGTILSYPPELCLEIQNGMTHGGKTLYKFQSTSETTALFFQLLQLRQENILSALIAEKPNDYFDLYSFKDYVKTTYHYCLKEITAQVAFKDEFYRGLVNQNAMWTENNYTLVPVSDVTEIGVADVFNLEVEEDNSYTANNAIVHNCQGATRF